MNEELPNFSKEEILRHYEQSELSEMINPVEPVKNKVIKKNDLSFMYFFFSAGILAGTASFLTILNKSK